MGRKVKVCAGVAYDLGYHLVWCAKHRRLVLTGTVAVRCAELARATCAEHDWQVTALEIDMGVASFLTTSDGTHADNPRYGRRSAARLADAQRDLARKQAGSNRRSKARARVAALHGKVRRQRLDHAHKTALWLVGHHDFIAHERLPIANMIRSASGTVEQPGTNVAQKAGLNRSILDAGWGVFLNVLHAKAESAGRVVVAVNPANTSRTCLDCGHCAAENRLTQAGFRCVACGYTGHADVVGATNVLRAGLAHQTAQSA